MICNLNHSCYETPQNSADSQSSEFFQLINLTSDSLEFLNRPNVFQNILILSRFVNTSIRLRSQSAQVTNSLNLSQSLSISDQQFKSVLSNLLLYPDILNETVVNKILNSTPNYNYLYSNYSADSTEPIPFLNLIQNNQIEPFMSFLYGPDLDSAEQNRDRNRIDDPEWIRSQTCNGSNYLLKGNNAQYLQEILCNLNDEQITNLFVQISTYLDLGKTKRFVFDQTDLSNPELALELISVIDALLILINEFENSGLYTNFQFNSFQDVFNNITNFDIPT